MTEDLKWEAWICFFRVKGQIKGGLGNVHVDFCRCEAAGPSQFGSQVRAWTCVSEVLSFVQNAS